MAKLSEAQASEIAELRERGWSYARLASRFNVSEGAIHYQCLKQGALSPRPNGPQGEGRANYLRYGKPVRRFTPDEDEALVRMTREGRHIKEICSALGRARTSVRMRLLSLAVYEDWHHA